MFQWKVALQREKLSEKLLHIYKKDIGFLKYKFVIMKAWYTQVVSSWLAFFFFLST